MRGREHQADRRIILEPGQCGFIGADEHIDAVTEPVVQRDIGMQQQPGAQRFGESGDVR